MSTTQPFCFHKQDPAYFIRISQLKPNPPPATSLNNPAVFNAAVLPKPNQFTAKFGQFFIPAKYAAAVQEYLVTPGKAVPAKTLLDKPRKMSQLKLNEAILFARKTASSDRFRWLLASMVNHNLTISTTAMPLLTSKVGTSYPCVWIFVPARTRRHRECPTDHVYPTRSNDRLSQPGSYSAH